MRRTLSALAVFAAVATAAAADQPDPAALAAQLGSPEYQAREAAAKSLDAIGAAALPALKAAIAGSADPELTARAEALAARIARRVENAKLIAPTPVELDLADTPTVTALAAIEKQAGYRFYFPTDTAPAARAKKITVKTKGKVPFWEAVDQVCQAAGLRLAGIGPIHGDPRLAGVPVTLRDGRFATLPQQAAPGFVPAVPEEARAAGADPVAKQEAEKQATLEKRAREADAILDAIRKQAEQAIQPGAPAAVQQAAALRALVAQRQALLASATSATSAAPFNILLDPRPGPRLPASLATAVRVEAVPAIESVLAAYQADNLVGGLRATPEPRLGLEHVTGVRITRAVGATGQELIANLVNPFDHHTVTAETMLRKGLMIQQRIVIVNGVAQQQLVQINAPFDESSGFQPAPALQTVFRLKAGDTGVAKLSELSGVLLGTVRTPPEELVAVTDLFPKGAPAAVRGESGATLQAKVTDENVDDTFTVDVTLTYSPNRVSVATPGRDEALILDKLAKAAIAGAAAGAPGAAASSRLSFVMQQGLILTDEAGRPFRLTRMPVRGIAARGRGGDLIMYTMQLTATRTSPEQSKNKPAKLAFYGTWLKPVEIPFTLKDVPVAAGKKS
jgi:hypothetical protein